MENLERVVKISIPDNDLLNWISTLRENGLTEKEIDAVLLDLNETYRSKKREFLINRALEILREKDPRFKGASLNAKSKERLRNLRKNPENELRLDLNDDGE